MWVKRAECHVSDTEQSLPQSRPDIMGVAGHTESALSLRGPPVCL